MLLASTARPQSNSKLAWLALAAHGGVLPVALSASSQAALGLTDKPAQACPIFKIAMKAGAAQRLITRNFVQGSFAETEGWGEWFATVLSPPLSMRCDAGQAGRT